MTATQRELGPSEFRSERSSIRGYFVVLFLILVVGAAARFCGVAHGLDLDEPRLAIWNEQNDEETQALAVRDHHLRGDFDPGAFWLWGSGGFHAYGFLDRALLPILSRMTGADDSQAALANNLSLVLLAHRTASILAALLSIALLARTLRREVSDRVALVAAFLLATSYLATREAHYGTLDQWLLLGTVVAIDRALVLARTPTIGGAAFAGALVGAFASFKYSGAALVAFLWIGLAFCRRGSIRRSASLAIVATLFAAFAYLACSPRLFSSLAPMLAGYASQKGLIGFEIDRVAEMASYHARESLWTGGGELLVVVAIGGFALVLARSRAGKCAPADGPPYALLAALGLATAVFPLSNTSHSVRQALPMMLALAIFGSIAIDALASRFSRGGRTSVRVVVLALLVAAPSIVRGASLDLLLREKDTRVDAMRLLEDSGAPPEQAIGVGFYGLPRTSGIAVRSPFMDWLDAVYRRKQVSRDQAKQLRPRFLIHDLSSGVDDALGWSDFAALAEQDYRVVLRADGRLDPNEPPLPDLIHGTPFHFVPFASPWTMKRPGPAFVVYERR